MLLAEPTRVKNLRLRRFETEKLDCKNSNKNGTKDVNENDSNNIHKGHSRNNNSSTDAKTGARTLVFGRGFWTAFFSTYYVSGPDSKFMLGFSAAGP